MTRAHPAGFGALLRACRVAARLSQEELSERSGLSLRTIGNLEQGRTRWPYRDTLRRLADGLDLHGQDRSAFMSSAGQRRGPGAEADGPSHVIAALGQHAAPQARSGAPVPRQLPAGVGHFTGRRAELGFLASLLDGPGAPVGGAAVVISAIGGTAGVGKTALAIQWAHQVAGQFPDGQLYVNLRGYHPGPVLAPAQALAGFLAALGVPGPQIPAGAEDRAAAYRSMLAGRRVLIVLDNARDSEQVRPLLPGEPGCLVVVTSRDTLAGLVARDGARRMLLDVLPREDAVTLLRGLIGHRVAGEPDAAARLAGMCGRLPLALRVAAELASARPALSLAELAGELEGRGRLDALEAGGDQATAVRAVFSWSCGHMTAGAARAFRLAALHPGADFDADAVAALTGTSGQEAARALAELTRASLIHQLGSGRYGMHDLLRAYAAELAAEDPGTGRRQALARLLDHYLYAARRAAGILFPADAPPPADAPGDASGAVAGDERAARAWLDAERANLTAVAAYAGEHGWAGHAAGLSAAMFRYLDAGGFLADALVIHGAAAQGAIQAGDRAAEADAVTSIGTVYVTLGRYQEAERRFQRGLRLSREATSHLGQLRALLNLSHVYLCMGAYPDAASTCQQGLELSRATGDRIREARALEIHGLIARHQGRYQQAVTWLRAAIEASRQAGDQVCLTDSLISLGDVEVRRGRYHQARRKLEEARTTARQAGYAIAETDLTAILGSADLREGRHQPAAQHLQQALAAFRDEGFSAGEAYVLCCLGELDLLMGYPAQATGRYRQALIIYQRVSEPFGEAEARNGLGKAALAQEILGDARAHYTAALAIGAEIASPEPQARAHEGLGDLSAAAGDTAAARPHWQQALTRYTELDVPPDTNRIRAKLAVTDNAPPPAGQVRSEAPPG